MDEFNAKQVAEPNSLEDPWLILRGQAYDVTEHLADHPGGTDIFIKAAGIDASKEFGNAGHSEDDFDIMRDYCMGNIKGSEKKKPKLKPLASLEPPKSENGGASSEARPVSKLANLGLFPVAVAGLNLVSRRHELALPKWMLSFLPHDSPILSERRSLLQATLLI